MLVNCEIFSEICVRKLRVIITIHATSAWKSIYSTRIIVILSKDYAFFLQTYGILALRAHALGLSGAVAFALAVKLALLVLAAVCEQIDND